MSYILDALKKSELQRSGGQASSPLAGKTSLDQHKSPAATRYGLLILTLLAIAFVLGWLRPWQPAHMAPVMPLPGQPADLPQRLPLPDTPATVRTQEPLAPARTQPAPAVRGHNPSPPALKPTPAPMDATEKIIQPAPPPPVSMSAPAEDRKIIEQSELPLELQQEIPAMVIAVHAYAGVGAKRMLLVNDLMLHEGDYLTPAIRLEQITVDGMVFSYKNYHFHHPAH